MSGTFEQPHETDTAVMRNAAEPGRVPLRERIYREELLARLELHHATLADLIRRAARTADRETSNSLAQAIAWMEVDRARIVADLCRPPFTPKTPRYPEPASLGPTFPRRPAGDDRD